MVEAWIERADREPESHRDVESVRRLLAGAVAADLDHRAACMDALARVTKALELDPVEASIAAIRDATPELVDGLLCEHGNIDGCTISVLRRVPPNDAAVERILGRLEAAGDGDVSLLLEALAQPEGESWPPAVEAALARWVDDPRAGHAAAYALYRGAYRIRAPSTVDRLAEAAADDVDWLVRQYAIYALCGLLSRPPHASRVEQRLRRLVAELDGPLRAHAEDALGRHGRR